MLPSKWQTQAQSSEEAGAGNTMPGRPAPAWPRVGGSQRLLDRKVEQNQELEEAGTFRRDSTQGQVPFTD